VNTVPDLFDAFKTRRSPAMVLASACALALMGMLLSSPLTAANSCDAVLGAIVNTGEVPAIVINPVDETVKVITSKGTCSESIDDWSNRDPISGAVKPAPKPKKHTTPPPAPAPKQPAKPAFTSSAPASPSGSGLPAATSTYTPEGPVGKPAPSPQPSQPPSPVVKAPPAKGKCDYRLNEVWETQIIKIEGVEHYLSRAFTIDLDSNNKADNVSFTFVDSDESKRTLHYFGVPGELSGRNYPAIKLPDDSLIGRICFGDVKYDKPKLLVNKTAPRSLIQLHRPDLAGQKSARDRGIEYQPKYKKKKALIREEPISWMLWGSVGGLVLILAGGGIFFIRSKKANAKDKPEEDDAADSAEEDDEEDGGKKPKKSKFSLAGLFKRKKKNKGADEDGEEGDEDGDAKGDDEEDKLKKKKKSKFSLGGLFKRKKKKGADAEDEDEDMDKEKDKGKADGKK